MRNPKEPLKSGLIQLIKKPPYLPWETHLCEVLEAVMFLSTNTQNVLWGQTSVNRIAETASSTFQILMSPSNNFGLVIEAGNPVADPRLSVYYIFHFPVLAMREKLESATRTLSFAFPLYCGMTTRCITAFSACLRLPFGTPRYNITPISIQNICWRNSIRPVSLKIPA